MKRFIGILVGLALAVVPVTAEVWKHRDARGNEARVEHPGVPASRSLAAAYKQRFFPNLKEFEDPELRVSYETTVTPGLKTARYYSLVGQGLMLYKDAQGNVIGAHPTKIFRTLNWDLQKDQAVTLGQLVRPERKKQLFSLLSQRAETPEALNPEWGLDFYLRKDGVAFYQPDAPHVAFGIEVVVPYKALRPLAAAGSPLLDPAVSGHP